MKFDKNVANQVIAALAGAKDVLSKQQFLGMRFEATPDTIEALRQSDHPDRDVVIGNLLVPYNLQETIPQLMEQARDLGITVTPGRIGNW